MKLRKLVRLATLLAMVASVAVPVSVTSPAHAGGTGVQPDPTGPACDTIDTTRHPQNSFRPPAPYATYQYDCTPSQDIVNWSFDAGDTKPGYLTANMTLAGPVPDNGDPITLMPAGVSELQYQWYFQTSLQNTKQLIGTDCVPDRNFAGHVVQGPVEGNTLTRYSTVSSQTCLKAKDAAHENNGDPAGATTVPVALKQPIFEVPHPAGDSWWMAIIAVVTFIDDGEGGVRCKPVPPVPTPPPQCLGLSATWGIYEGYSGFQSSPGGGSGSNVGPPFILSHPTPKSIRVQAPYNAALRGSDGDGMLDDNTLFPTLLGKPGAKITAVVAGTDGVITDPVLGVFGFLVVRDWAPNAGFELRQVPRSPAYAPSSTSVTCRYPAGHFPAPPAPVTIAPAPGGVNLGTDTSNSSGTAGSVLAVRVPGVIGVDTSPFSRPWWIEPRFDDPTFAPVNGQSVAGPTTPAPPPGQSLATGKDEACNYTVVPTGLHYFDVTADFTMK